MTMGHNRADDQHLRAIVQRIEQLEEEKAARAQDIREVYAEAKGEGFDAKVLRKVIARRKRNRDELQQEEEMLQLYIDALGDLPLFAASTDTDPGDDTP